MLHFFRKIRRDLLANSQFFKYLKYAVGEIILVVLGILIALFINNWNNKRQIEKQELKFLLEIRQNLEQDIEDAVWNKNHSRMLMNSTQYILEIIELKEKYNDSMDIHYANLLKGAVFVKNTSAYQNLEAIGLNTISNNELRGEITKLYTSYYNFIEGVDNNVEYFRKEIILKQFLSNFNSILNIEDDKDLTGSFTFVGATPREFEDLIENDSFIEFLKLNFVLKRNMNYEYTLLETRIQYVIDLIDSELEQRNKSLKRN